MAIVPSEIHLGLDSREERAKRETSTPFSPFVPVVGFNSEVEAFDYLSTIAAMFGENNKTIEKCFCATGDIIVVSRTVAPLLGDGKI